MTQERLDIPVGIDLSQVKAALAQAKKDAQFFSNNLKAAGTQATKVELEQTKVANTLNAIAKMSDDGIKRIFIAGAEGIKAIDLEALKVEAIATIEAMNTAWDSQGQRISNIMDGINQLNERIIQPAATQAIDRLTDSVTTTRDALAEVNAELQTAATRAQSLPPLPPPPAALALPAPAPVAAASAAGPTAIFTAATMAAVAARGMAVAMGVAAAASVAVQSATRGMKKTIDEARTSFDLFRAAQNAPVVDPTANFQKKDLQERAALEANRIEKARATRDAEISGYKDTAAAAAKSADIIATANARAAASAAKHEWQNRKTVGSVNLLRTAFAPVGGLVGSVASEYGALNPKLAETADKSRRVAAESRTAAAEAAKKQYVLTGALNEGSTTTEQYGHVVRAAGLSQRLMVREIEGGGRVINRTMTVVSAITTPLRAMRTASERNREEWRLLRGLLGQPEPEGPGLIAKSFVGAAKASVAMADSVGSATRKIISRVAAMDVVQKEIKYQKAQWEELKTIFREDIASPLAATFAPAAAKLKEFTATAKAAGSQAVASLRNHLHNLAQTPFVQRVFGAGATAAKHFATAANAITPRLKSIGSAAVDSAVKFTKWTQSQKLGQAINSGVAKSMLFLHQRTRILHPVFSMVGSAFGKLFGRFRKERPAAVAVATASSAVAAAATSAVAPQQQLATATGQVTAAMNQAAPATQKAARAIREVAPKDGKGGFGSLLKGLVSSKLALGAMATGALAWGGSFAVATETATVKFGTLLRDMDQGKALVDELTQFSAVTPFSNEELRKSAGLLLAAQVPANQITDKLQMLGDIAAGTSQPVADITKVFQKMASTGKVELGSLNQLAERGVPIYGALQDQLGVTRTEMLKMIGSGKVGFGDMEAALRSLTAEGGVFAGGMAAQSQTFAGLWSTLKDNVGIALEGIVSGFMPFAKRMVDMGIAAAQGFQQAWQQVQPVFNAVLGMLSAYWKAMLGVFMAGWNLISTTASTVFGFLTGESGNFFDGFVETAVVAITRVTFWFETLPDQLTLIFLQSGLAVGSFFADMGHWITVAMPTYLSYLRNEWLNMFTDIASLTKTIFTNMTSNIMAVMDAVWAFIKSGGTASFSVAWTPLLDGFKRTTAQIPDVPSRVLSDYEKALQSDIDDISKRLTAGSNEAVEKALAALQMPEKKVELGGAMAADSSVIEDDGTTNQKSRDSFTVDSLERGSAEALKAIFSSQQRDKTPKDQLAEQKKTNSLLSQIAAAGGNTPQLAGAFQ